MISPFKPPSEASETTSIPVGGDEGLHGAMAFFAVLAYPGTGQNDHAKGDRAISAMTDCIAGFKKLRRGYKRVSTARIKQTSDPWLSRSPALKNEPVCRTLNHIERVIVERRLLAPRVSIQLAGIWASKQFSGQGSVRSRPGCWQPIHVISCLPRPVGRPSGRE